MKVVIDTNALINASEDDYNYANRIVDEVLAGKVQAFANIQTVRENKLIIRQKITDSDYLQKMERFFECVEIVEGPRLHVVEDEEDNKILASAVAAGVDYLVTSDWHLLKLEQYEDVKMITPQGFWAEYEQNTGQGWQDWMNKFLQ